MFTKFNVFKFFSILFILFSCLIPDNCSQNKFKKNDALAKFGNSNFNSTTQLFLLRPSSLTYFFSLAFLTTISEKSKQKNHNSNTFLFVNNSIWDYDSLSPVSKAPFNYHFEALYNQFSDLWTDDYRSKLPKLGIITNTKELDLPPSSIDVENLNLKIILALNNKVKQITHTTPRYSLYIDDLLFSKLYENRKDYLYALLCYTENIYILTEGMSQAQLLSSSITNRYYNFFEKEHKQQISLREKKTRWSDIFRKTEIGSPDFYYYYYYSTKFLNSISTIERSNFSYFLNWYDKISIFFFDPDYINGYIFTEKNSKLNISNIWLDLLDYPKNFDLQKEVFINVFKNFFFGHNFEINRLSDLFADDMSRLNYDPNKKNVIILLGKEWSKKYVQQNTDSQEETDAVLSILKLSVKKYEDLYSPKEYNYFFKGHPRASADLIETTNFILSGSTVKPIQLEPSVPFELFFNVDNILHSIDKKYELINLDDYLYAKDSHDLKTVFLSYNYATSAINTTMSFIVQKTTENCWKNVINNLIPDDGKYINDSFFIDGLSKSITGRSIYNQAESYKINLDYTYSVVENLIKINHFPSVVLFKKYSDWIK